MHHPKMYSFGEKTKNTHLKISRNPSNKSSGNFLLVNCRSVPSRSGGLQPDQLEDHSARRAPGEAVFFKLPVDVEQHLAEVCGVFFGGRCCGSCVFVWRMFVTIRSTIIKSFIHVYCIGLHFCLG